MIDTANDCETIEVQLLLDAVYRRYGFDFRDYARPSISRRITRMVRQEGFQSVSELQGRLLRDSNCMERFLLNVTVNVTTMFRDPEFYRCIRETVVRELERRPFIRIWHVGCSTGEEVISMAILLHEEGLYDRCRIYATDMNAAVLATAKAGIFPLGSVQEYTSNYLKAGGKGAFSDYYTARYHRVIFQRHLAERITFSQHNLVSDGSFNEFHLVLCRNVMIYFNRSLADRVHRLIYDSLASDGFLGLGDRETIKFSPQESCYAPIGEHGMIFRKIK